MTLATHTAREVALAILSRRHKRLLAGVNREPLPHDEIWWGGECRRWLAKYPGSREQPTTRKEIK